MTSSDLDQRVISENAVASKILWHCVEVINAVRHELGCNSVSVFKIGLTSDPIQGRRSYFEQNFKCFDVLRKVASRSC